MRRGQAGDLEARHPPRDRSLKASTTVTRRSTRMMPPISRSREYRLLSDELQGDRWVSA
jgi:hypothetical protein